MKSIARIENLRLNINGREILKDISFEVYEGEIFTILGGSGSGKTTITKCLVGLYRPTSGKVEVFGKEVPKLSQFELDRMRKDIGYVFQGAALFDSLKVWENVVFYYLEHGDFKEEELREMAKKYLSLVGLSEEHLDMYPSELSGGMRKRVGIARAIATEPRLIIYDEPTSGLDPITSRLIDELIVSLRDKTNSTAIVVSHDLVSAFSISDRILILRDGELVQIGTKEEILNSSIPFVREFIKKGLGDLQAVKSG
ncbi:MAG: ATP-binding cassette domain-containing protein [Aquificaceae bacterium]|jgi:phospholipid/cholesterol/gamma-HCH transport system ATP-binding protein|nr:ATP-binding cassette domain-containing protein [Aquificaceae bacterium]MDM7267061.1 ATP-binding cassette domain-containing protein [Aquificaceae bacterium]